jgi:hypothetical protein
MMRGAVPVKTFSGAVGTATVWKLDTATEPKSRRAR